MQAEVFMHALGVVPSVQRPQHAVVIGTEFVKERYEVAVTPPTLRINPSALQQVRPHALADVAPNFRRCQTCAVYPAASSPSQKWCSL